MFEYFDIHSHLYFPDYDGDRENEIEKIKKANIGTITVGTDFNSSRVAMAMAEKNDNFFASIGQHPGEMLDDSVFDERLISLADDKKVVAIGECGLDYFRIAPMNQSVRLIQKTIFEYHIDLALSVEKPLMLHIRPTEDSQDAYSDALDILEHHAKISGDKLKGNVHFFAGDVDVLNRFLNIGFTVSFTGVITFTHDYDELIEHVPLDMIMSETDSPFVAPVPHRKSRNSPLYVPIVVEKIAEIRGEPLETVKEAVIANTLRQFPGIAS
ncbi:MAG: TatD family hydrolase [Minisyncoccia bacterium]